jgi:hypothetical protein
MGLRINWLLTGFYGCRLHQVLHKKYHFYKNSRVAPQATLFFIREGKTAFYGWKCYNIFRSLEKILYREA